ncbi:DUF5719 family protein [Cellulomonas sp. PSBB021]|uniref:DUF5719 family protein n=1 Tax=Cellulomonas sp. PSBB021 TaxID=2003551 RepID=UPI000B8D758B|nr:DUF5719 family protein [Cellulomonas sp. PSBB021]ASR55028.1 hypothetical protein CBP52_07915 [Cellulomonas sp. PSBB021]
MGARVTAVTAVRLVSGAAVAALVAGVAVLGSGLPSPATDEVTVPGALVDVPFSPTRLVCAGPLVLPQERDAGDAFDPVPVTPLTSLVAVATSSGGGAVTDLGGGVVAERFGAGASSTTSRWVTEPLVVQAEPTDDPASVAAATSAYVTAGDLRGLAAASCQAPTTDAWLLGGSTELGATALLVLQNAGSTAAVVHLDVYGATGPVDLDTEQYLVAPGAERVVVLGGLAPQERRVAVHVTATGGRVTAHVQDSTLDGFTPTGTDLVVASAPPSRRQVVPGVAVLATEVDDPDAGAVRLLAPGGGTTTARVRLLGPDGVEDLPGAGELVLEPGVVTDVPLGGLPAGAYTLVVEADRAVVASAMLARPGAPTQQDPDVATRERAWVPSVPAPDAAAATDAQVVAVPDRATGTLVLGAVARSGALDADGTATAEVRVLGPDGEPVVRERVELALGRTAAWDLTQLVPAGTRVRGVQVVPDGGAWLAGGLVAQVDRPDGTLLSVLVPVPADLVSGATEVREDPRLGTR